MSYSNNREHVLALINAGGATRKSICDTIGFKNTSLASVFSQLRLMGQYPVEDADTKVLSLVDKATYEGRVVSTPKVELTPGQRAEKLFKALLRAERAHDRAKENKGANEEAGLVFKAEKANLDLLRYRVGTDELATKMLADHQAEQARLAEAAQSAGQPA